MSPPFVYTYRNGTVVAPNANGVYAGAASCTSAAWVGKVGLYVFVGFYAVSALVLFNGGRWMFKRMRERREARAVAAKEAAERRRKDAGLDGVDVLDPEDDPQHKKPDFGKFLWLWVILAVGSSIGTSIVTTNAQQQDLSVPQSDAIADSNNFLQPFRDVFVFFEDGMTVRIGQAVGAQDFETVGALIKWGATGGAMCGVLGAAISTAATFMGVVFKFFVPDRQGVTLPSNCPLLPSSVAELQTLAQPYWILTAWAWPALFVQKGCIGVFIGSGETQNWAIATILASGAALALYFGLINVINKTTAVGLMGLIPPYVFVVIAFAVFVQTKYLVQFRLRESMFGKAKLKVAWTAAKDGAALMLKDLCLTVQNSVTNMLAARLGLGQQYQLSIFKNMQTSFGFSPAGAGGNPFALMIGYSIRLVGSRLLGMGNAVGFIWMSDVYLVGGLLFGLVSTGAMLAGVEGAPYYFSSSTVCQYQMQLCSVSVYNAIFGDIDPGYVLNAIMMTVNTMWLVLTAVLYACLDFEYIRNVTIATTVLVYLPASLIAFYAIGTIFALQFAAALPTFVLTGLYYHRYRVVLCKKLTAGAGSGLRATHAAKEHRRSLRSSLTRPLVKSSGVDRGSSQQLHLAAHREHDVEALRPHDRDKGDRGHGVYM